MPEQIGYATALLNLLAKSEAAEERPRRRTRGKALHTGKVSDLEEIALGNLLREIAEISNPEYIAQPERLCEFAEKAA
jgi:hypothetical protein